jgi:hypothetical protein
MDCYICSTSPEKNIPLLTCGHYLCRRCYDNLKSNKINRCQICNKKFYRGTRKNKVIY